MRFARVSQISNQNNIAVFYENTLWREYYKTLMMNTIYHNYDEYNINLLFQLIHSSSFV